MTDAVNEPKKTATISFSLPERWTLAHWDTYVAGGAAYQLKNPEASQASINYMGSLALIKSGAVHVVDAPAKFKDYLDAADQTLTPVAVIGTVLSAVSRSLERAINFPLLDWM